MEIRVKYVVVFQEDGLDVEGAKDILKDFGNLVEVKDDELDEETPVKMFCMDGSFGDYVRIKLQLFCVEPQKYVLFPMANAEEKAKVLKELAQ